MATPSAVAVALKTTLAGISSLNVYDYVPDSIVEPAAVIVPGPVERLTIKKGYDRREWRVLIIVSRTADHDAQHALMDFLASSGTPSIRARIDAAPTLGIAGDVNATWVSDDGFGVIDVGGVFYYGSTITVSIAAKGDS